MKKKYSVLYKAFGARRIGHVFATDLTSAMKAAHVRFSDIVSVGQCVPVQWEITRFDVPVWHGEKSGTNKLVPTQERFAHDIRIADTDNELDKRGLLYKQ